MIPSAGPLGQTSHRLVMRTVTNRSLSANGSVDCANDRADSARPPGYRFAEARIALTDMLTIFPS